MGRAKKPLPAKESRLAKEEEAVDANGATLVQSRSRRTIKPNPKYNSKEIVPLKRHSSGEDDEEEDEHEGGQGDNTEDDEDFRDDGAKDSDVDDTPPAKKRGRPRTAEAPRSEPPPQRKLQQLRAGLKEVAMSATKIMQQSAAGLLDKKRKIDYDSEDVEQPEVKRRPGGATNATSITRGSSRLVAAPTSGEKENTAATVPKKPEANAFTLLMNNKNAAKTGPGVATRRQQTKEGGSPAAAAASAATTTSTPPVTITTAAKVVATPKATPVQIRTASPAIISRSATKVTPAQAKSMIQVRRATPMNSGSSSVATTTIATATIARQVNSSPQIVLNRTPQLKTRPAAVVQTTTPPTIKSPTKLPPLAWAAKAVSPAVSATPAAATTPNSVSAALNRGSLAAVNTLSVRTPNKMITTETTTVRGSKSTVTIPAGSEIEQMADGTTARITTLETRYVVRLPPDEDPQLAATREAEKPMINLLQLRNEIKSLKMPSDRWAYQLKLVRSAAPDPQTEVPDRPGYAVHSIALNRLASEKSSPRLLNGQKMGAAPETTNTKHDRTLELFKNRFVASMDGRPVRLIGAPRQVGDKEELEMLLEIMDHVSTDSPVVAVNKPVFRV